MNANKHVPLGISRLLCNGFATLVLDLAERAAESAGSLTAVGSRGGRAMIVFVLNVGSTTLKYACVDTTTGRQVVSGQHDGIGASGKPANHMEAVDAALKRCKGTAWEAIGHRVVQGGTAFSAATAVDHRSLTILRELDSLAPLHNPPARKVIEALHERLPDVPQWMVFDTAYYASLPPAAYRYAIAEKAFQEYGVRRYGMHGTSHGFVTSQAIAFLEASGAVPRGSAGWRIITLHLGGGASATASLDGRAIDTSMGMTPLEGLVMATRTGDLDPAVPLHLLREAGMSVDQVDRLLNRESGLKGLCGEADLRRVLQRVEQRDAAAELAVEIYIRRIVKISGGYAALLGGLDALVFTAGVGEHSAEIRQRVVDRLGLFGLAIDRDRNATTSDASEPVDLTSADAAVKTLVVPTDEELAIARQVAAAMQPQ